jgi:hypothetical protein
MWVPTVPELLWVILMMALLIGCVWGIFSHWDDNLLQRAGMAVMAIGAVAELKATYTFVTCPRTFMFLSIGATLFLAGAWWKARRMHRGAHHA